MKINRNPKKRRYLLKKEKIEELYEEIGEKIQLRTQAHVKERDFEDNRSRNLERKLMAEKSNSLSEKNPSQILSIFFFGVLRSLVLFPVRKTKPSFSLVLFFIFYF